MKAIWNDVVIAESNETVIVEGNHYFPKESVKWDFFKPNHSHTTCPWKGVASYYDIEIKGEVVPAAAWYYPEPKPAASMVKNRIAFWKGVIIKA